MESSGNAFLKTDPIYHKAALQWLTWCSFPQGNTSKCDGGVKKSMCFLLRTFSPLPFL